MKKILGVALVAGVAAAAGADIIVSYNSTGLLGTEASMAGAAGVANVTPIDMTRGAGLSPSGAGNSFSSLGWTQAPDDYFAFGFTVDAGYTVNIDRMIIGTRSSGTGPGTLGLYYNVDGFAAPVYIFNQPNAAFLNTDTALVLTGLTGTVEFRLIQIGTNSSSGGTTGASGTFRVADYFDGINFTDSQFQGTITPSPASLALLSIGGLVATRRRRA